MSGRGFSAPAPEPAQVPDAIKRLQACTLCKLVKTESQFAEFGCDNCGKDASWTPHFKGIVAMMMPTQSWVAKKTNLGGGRIPLSELRPGVYAVKVPGEDEVGGDSDDYDDDLDAEAEEEAEGEGAEDDGF